MVFPDALLTVTEDFILTLYHAVFERHMEPLEGLKRIPSLSAAANWIAIGSPLMPWG